MSKKEKITLQKEVATRKVEIPSNLVWFAYNVLANLPFFAPKYHPTYIIRDNPKDCPTGCFVIWNHLSRRDYLFLKVMLHPRKFNMVAGYAEFFRSHLAWLFKVAKVIPKKPFYNNDMGCVVAMTKIIKKGGVVTFSPEGTASLFGDNQPITPGTARFLKKMNVPVYCADYRGHLLSSNKVYMKDKPGKTEITLYKLFSPEDLQKLEPEEIETKINEVFHHDDFEWNKVKQYRYKGKNNMCTRLEDALYECPKCGKRFTTLGTKDTLKCLECGNGFTFDDRYNMTPLHEDDVLASSPSKWAQWERQNIIKEIRKDPNFEFKGHYKIGGLPLYKTLKKHALCEIQGEADFIVNHQGVHIIGTRNNEPCEIHMLYKDLYSPCLEDDFGTLTFYPDGVSTDVVIDDRKGGYLTMLIQEMHRLHENYWKNFPWFDYMYENLDEPSKLN